MAIILSFIWSLGLGILALDSLMQLQWFSSFWSFTYSFVVAGGSFVILTYGIYIKPRYVFKNRDLSLYKKIGWGR